MAQTVIQDEIPITLDQVLNTYIGDLWPTTLPALAKHMPLSNIKILPKLLVKT